MNNDTQTQQLAFGQQPTLNNSGIDMQALLDEYRLSKSYVEQYTRDFPQLDQIVDGIPLNADPDVPFVGDTTLTGYVHSIPAQSLQQLPVFSVTVNGTENSIAALLCTFLLKDTAFNEDTFGKGLLSTLQLAAEQALTHGYAPLMAAMGSMYNDFGTTMRAIHFSDTSPEPGITDHNETGYDYLTANLTATRVKRILKDALRNPNTTWNTDLLKQVLASSPRAKDYSSVQGIGDQNQAGAQAGPTYEFVTRYETGQDGTVITFCPEVSDAPLRVLESKSKWGYPRINYLVIDPAALTPFGKSRVRMASPIQNLSNIYLGQIAAMLLINSKPPILKRGRFIKPVELKRGVVWETLDQNANASLVNMDNGALEQFGEMQSQFAIQIQNVMLGSAGVVNGGNSAAGFSKTGPGVKQQNQFTNISTNQITKILENFLRQYALVALDTLISEQSGDVFIIVDDATKNAMNQIQAGAVGDDNKIAINWERFYAAIEKWSIKITVSLSKDEIDDQKRGDAQDMLTVLAQNAQNLGPEAQQKIAELTDILMEDLTPTVKPLTIQPAASVMPDAIPTAPITAPTGAPTISQ